MSAVSPIIRGDKAICLRVKVHNDIDNVPLRIPSEILINKLPCNLMKHLNFGAINRDGL